MKYRENILNESMPKCYPFLKWAGGKTQLLAKLKEFIPQSNHSQYFEPFLGGGAMFFYMISNNKLCTETESHLIDINVELINTYKVIKSNVEELIHLLSEYQNDYYKSPIMSYYDLRDNFNHNATDIEKAARTIALNKTCYNGLYRVNRNGEFNVPIGRYKKPVICNSENLRNVNTVLHRSRTHFYVSDYKIMLLGRAKENDFIYLDPPYNPVSTTASFTGYTDSGFTKDDQKVLSRVFRDLDKRGCKVLLSNSDTSYIRDLYNDFSEYMYQVDVLRSINSSSSRRTGHKELLISNYNPNT